MIGDILKIVGGFFEPAAKLIDDLHTSDEERLKIKESLALIEEGIVMKILEYSTKILEYDNKVMELQAKVITAESTGKSWIQRNWRPVTMLVFLFLVVCDSFGWLKFRLAEDAWDLLKIGLGGYVVGRTAEKVIPSAIREIGKLRTKS